MELEEIKNVLLDICIYKGDKDGLTAEEYSAIKSAVDHLTKQEKMIENTKDRIEYYLMGNSTLNDFNIREKELEKLLNILKKAEESE